MSGRCESTSFISSSPSYDTFSTASVCGAAGPAAGDSADGAPAAAAAAAAISFFTSSSLVAGSCARMLAMRCSHFTSFQWLYAAQPRAAAATSVTILP